MIEEFSHLEKRLNISKHVLKILSDMAEMDRLILDEMVQDLCCFVLREDRRMVDN